MKKWGKRLALAGVLFVGLVVALIALPFLIDFNQFKPQIQNAIAEKVNAKVDFESARLTVLGGLGVRLKKVTMVNSDPEFNGVRFFAVDELIFRTRIRPLFDKKFIGTIEIEGPEIVIVKHGIKNNLSALIASEGITRKNASPAPSNPSTSDEKPKSSVTTGPGTDSNTADSNTADSSTVELQKNVVIENLSIANASVTLREQSKKDTPELDTIRIKNLDINVSNIGVDRDIKTDIRTQTESDREGLRIGGPVELQLTTRLKMSQTGQDWQSLEFKGNVELGKLSINVREAFVKPSGLPLNLQFRGQATPQYLDVTEATLNLHNLNMKGFFNLSDFKLLNAKSSFVLQSSELQKLGEILPQHKELLLNAALNMSVGLEGPLTNIENIKTSLSLKALLSGSDADLKWQSTRLKPLQGKLQLVSNRLDLGAIIKPFLKSEKASVPVTAVSEKAPAASDSQDKTPKSDQVGSKASPPKGGTTVPQTGSASPVKETQSSQNEAQEFTLTPEQRDMLAKSDVVVNLAVGEFKYDTLVLRKVATTAHLQDLVLSLPEFGLEAFGGKADLSAMTNLGANPISYKAQIGMKSVKAEELLAFVRPEAKDVLDGLMSLRLVLEGRGTTRPNINRTLNGTGDFKFDDGLIHTASLMSQMEKEFDSFAQGLSVLSAAEGLLASAEKIMNDPLVKQAGGDKELDLAKIKADYEKVKNLKLSEKLSQDRSLKDLAGTLVVREGRTHIDFKKASVDGILDFAGVVGLDQTLGGTALFTASQKLKEKMIAQSRHATLLFDNKGGLEIMMALAGTVQQPAVKVDLSPIRDRFTQNARERVEQEVRKKAEEVVLTLLKKKRNEGLVELKKMQEELKGKAEAELKKAEADPANQKAKDDLKKAIDKNKAKLKGIFGR